MNFLNVRSRKVNDFLSSKANKDIIKEIKIERSLTFLKEYTQSSTIHGVQHIFREGETVFHRGIWSALFILCLTGAAYMVHKSWQSFMNYPIAISVEDTHYPLDSVLFPAIAVCPTNKILLSNARKYLQRYGNKGIVNDTRIKDFLSALVLFQHPMYSQMEHFLIKASDLLPKLTNINITELMMKSLPKCEQIFVNCYWQGNKKNCCREMFHLQRSEEGFCYSFNSLSSERYKHCSYLDVSKPGCKLKSSTSIGPTTGLEVYFKLLDPSDYEAIEFTGSPKIKVQAHNPNEFPEAGMGTLLPINSLNKINLAIKPTMTASSDEIRRLQLHDRGCTFKDENVPYITRTYSQRSCLLECRMKFMIKICHCIPYYFYKRENKFPVCNSLQLLCIVNVSQSLRFYKPPNRNIKGFQPEESMSPLDCKHCLPTCNEVKYEIVMDLTKDQFTLNKNLSGYLDAFYKTSGAVKYKRDITYDFVKLLVDMGGIGGLFLGGSLLSILEILYWFAKSLISFSWSLKHDNFKRKKNKTKRFMSNHLWYN